MSKVNSYSLDNNVSVNDLLFGSDSEDSLKSKNFKIGDIVALASSTPGPQGPVGQNGLSAYQIAINNGFVGTEQEWLDSLKASGFPYKVFTALITQIGTSAPTLLVLQNTFNGTFTATRQNTGRYTITPDTSEITERFYVSITPSNTNTKILSASKASTTIQVRAIEVTTGLYADELSNISFELRVYPNP